MSNWLGYFIKLIWTFFEKPGLFTEVNAVNFVGSQDTTVIEMCALVDFLLDIVSIETYVWAHHMCSRILNLRFFLYEIFSVFCFLCCWHVIRKVIWYVTKLRIFEILCNIYLFSSSCLSPVLAVSVLYFEKKDRNRFREYSKIRDFVTYQITFFMTCQQH